MTETVEVMSYEDLAAKIEWEGGLWGAISYGIRAEEVPEDIRGDWQKLREAAQIVTRLERKIEKELS